MKILSDDFEKTKIVLNRDLQFKKKDAKESMR